MSIKLYTVECSIHGKLEVTKLTKVCPICGRSVKRKYDVPNVHYKGSGWAGKEK